MASWCLKVIRNIPLVAAMMLTVYVFHNQSVDEYVSEKQNDVVISNFLEDPIHLSVVACKGGENIVQETMTLLKSVAIFAESQVQVHLFTDELEDEFINKISKWPEFVLKKLNFNYYPVAYPLPPHEVSMLRDWWGPCASFRLFLPQILHTIDSIIYVDTDVIFLSAIDDLWKNFEYFNEEQVGALAPRVGWNFNVPASNPNYIMNNEGKLTQVNSGVFLMNLTRMREKRFSTDPAISDELFSWDQKLLLPLYYKHKKDMFGDQNLINILFHYNHNLLYYLPCRFNYHHKFCFENDRPDRTCESADEDGAHIIHGSANTFYNKYSPAFGAINDAFIQYNFEDDLSSNLLRPMINKLEDSQVENHEHCGGKTEVFTKHIRKIIQERNILR